MFDFIKKFFKKVKDFLYDFFNTSTAEIVKEIGYLAYDVVKYVEENSEPGDDKFKIAKEYLIQKLEEKAIHYTTVAINVAIEMAVALLKEKGEEKKK